VPPSPTTITKEEPGGDAADPEVAALQRLDQQRWGARSDRDASLLVPLPDGGNWRRVKFWTVDTFAGFRYGDDHHGVAAVFLRDAPKSGSDSHACLHDFERWAAPLATGLGMKLSPSVSAPVTWRGQEVAVIKREGKVLWGLSEKQYAAVYGAFTPWEGQCLIVAYGFPMMNDGELAKKVRDRFAEEAFARFYARGKEPPHASR
jgi:hypothetical protein